MPEVEDVSDWTETPDATDVPAAPVEVPATPTPQTATPEPVEPAEEKPEDGDEPEMERVRDARGRWQTKAKKDKASARFTTLSRENIQLRERIAQIEAKVTPQSAPTSTHIYQAPVVPKVEFTEAEPTLDQFADKDDPYGAWQRALAQYDRRKERAEEQAIHMQAHVQQQSYQAEQEWNGKVLAHQERLVAAASVNPQIGALLQAAHERNPPTPVMNRAIMLDSDSVNMALFLASHPSIQDELVLWTAAQPVTQQTVATTQRLLRQRMTTVGSGAAVPSPSFTPAPRPPTPLRTAPMTIGETVPGDEDSVEAHERHFGHKRSYRR